MADGAREDCSTLKILAKAGSGGKNRNVARDLLARTKRDLGVPMSGFPVEILQMDDASGRTRLNTALIICPHELFANIYKCDPSRKKFYDRFGTPDVWAEFWTANIGEVWFEEHPQRDYILANRETVVPYSVCCFVFVFLLPWSYF